MKKTHLINQMLDSNMKLSWPVILKMKRFLSMSCRYTHCLGYKNILEIHAPEKVDFLQNIPLGLFSDHVR